MKNFHLSVRCRSFCLGLVSLVVLQPCFPAFLAAQTMTAEDHYKQGRQKYIANDDQGALESAQLAISLDAENWEAYQLAGYSYSKMGNRKASEDHCLKSLQLHPDNPSLRGFVDRNYSQVNSPAQLPEGLRNPAGVWADRDLSVEMAAEKKKSDAIGVVMVAVSLVALALVVDTTADALSKPWFSGIKLY